MKPLFTQPYRYFWAFIPFVIGLSLLGQRDTIDIQMHDTYFVVDLTHMAFFYSTILVVLGLLYWWFRKRQLINWITVLHVVVSLITILVLQASSLLVPHFVSLNYELYQKVNQLITMLMLAFILAQLLFVLNLIISGFKRA